MWDDLFYRILAGLLQVTIWGGDLTGDENLPGEGPAVFVANHAFALGPIAVTSSFPIRLYPWVIGDMLDWDKAAAYLNRDFVTPQLHIPPPFGMPLSRLISQASVRLLQAVGSIPVWEGADLLETYLLSLDHLEKGRSLLIFPEDPAQAPDEQCQMRPFKKGFARLGEMYFDRTQSVLRFYPAAVHSRLRQVKLGKGIAFSPNNERTRERVRIKSVLESTIRSMLLEMTLQSYSGVPLPH